jgi:hypothetical protein
MKTETVASLGGSYRLVPKRGGSGIFRPGYADGSLLSGQNRPARRRLAVVLFAVIFQFLYRLSLDYTRELFVFGGFSATDRFDGFYVSFSAHRVSCSGTVQFYTLFLR